MSAGTTAISSVGLGLDGIQSITPPYRISIIL